MQEVGDRAGTVLDEGQFRYFFIVFLLFVVVNFLRIFFCQKKPLICMEKCLYEFF